MRHGCHDPTATNCETFGYIETHVDDGLDTTIHDHTAILAGGDATST